MLPKPSTTCVIGDIHGCHASLCQLLDRVRSQADTFVFLGDYIDRGPGSKEVVSTLIAQQKEHPRTIFLQGNHDAMFLQFLTGQVTSLFLRAGGKETLMSYGLTEEASPFEIKQKVPTDHMGFFQSLALYWEDPHAIYVHAGLEPGRHLCQQRAEWCLWARERFLYTRINFGKPVVFGHTVFPEPLISKTRIGIDTGAVYGGRLTALLLPQKKFISVPGEQIISQHTAS